MLKSARSAETPETDGDAASAQADNKDAAKHAIRWIDRHAMSASSYCKACAKVMGAKKCYYFFA
jgi:hypothetical protein